MLGLAKIGEYSHLIQAGAVSRPFPRKIVCDLRRRIEIGRVHFWRFSSRENLSRNPTGLCIQRIRSYCDASFASLRFPWTTYETFHRGTFVTRSKRLVVAVAVDRWRTTIGKIRSICARLTPSRRKSHKCEWPTCDRCRSSVSTSLDRRFGIAVGLEHRVERNVTPWHGMVWRSEGTMIVHARSGPDKAPRCMSSYWLYADHFNDLTSLFFSLSLSFFSVIYTLIEFPLKMASWHYRSRNEGTLVGLFKLPCRHHWLFQLLAILIYYCFRVDRSIEYDIEIDWLFLGCFYWFVHAIFLTKWNLLALYNLYQVPFFPLSPSN